MDTDRQIDHNMETAPSFMKAGFIKRYDYKGSPPKVEYSLTELGESFMPVMEYIKSWGEKYLET